jgi:hypothetical protein
MSQDHYSSFKTQTSVAIIIHALKMSMFLSITTDIIINKKKSGLAKRVINIIVSEMYVLAKTADSHKNFLNAKSLMPYHNNIHRISKMPMLALVVMLLVITSFSLYLTFLLFRHHVMCFLFLLCF